MNSTIRTCEFKTDARGNAIGCKVNAMDLFQERYVESEYLEQQKVSEELPKIADKSNNKLFAEAFRFGNMEEPNAKQSNGIKNVIKHLERCLNVSASKENLQFVKFYDNNKNIKYRINYYDPSVGRSLVYNEEGKYMYQMEYNRDNFGNIVACLRI